MKPQQFSVTCNASGNAILAIQPFNLFDDLRFAYIFNDATLSMTTGNQTPIGTPVLSPYSGIAASIEAF